jgi:hypothetical protein
MGIVCIRSPDRLTGGLILSVRQFSDDCGRMFADLARGQASPTGPRLLFLQSLRKLDDDSLSS